jgi:hypothetical protein
VENSEKMEDSGVVRNPRAQSFSELHKEETASIQLGLHDLVKGWRGDCFRRPWWLQTRS